MCNGQGWKNTIPYVKDTSTRLYFSPISFGRTVKWKSKVEDNS
jgi:hypothetical protein